MTHYEKRTVLLTMQEGRTFTTSERGKSMEPLIMDQQQFDLTPIKWEKCQKDDIVFCKVNQRYFTHKVLDTSISDGVLVGNNKGAVNGWTKKVYGKVVKIHQLKTT